MKEQQDNAASNAYHDAPADAKVVICKDVLDLSGLIFAGLDKAAKQFSETNRNFKGSAPVFMMAAAVKIVSELLDKEMVTDNANNLINELKNDSIELLEKFIEDIGPLGVVLGENTKLVNFVRLLGIVSRIETDEMINEVEEAMANTANKLSIN